MSQNVKKKKKKKLEEELYWYMIYHNCMALRIIGTCQNQTRRLFS